MPFIFPILSTAPANTEAEEASILLACAAPLSGTNSSGGGVLFPPKPPRKITSVWASVFFPTGFFPQVALFVWRRVVWVHAPNSSPMPGPGGESFWKINTEKSPEKSMHAKGQKVYHYERKYKGYLVLILKL